MIIFSFTLLCHERGGTVFSRAFACSFSSILYAVNPIVMKIQLLEWSSSSENGCHAPQSFFAPAEIFFPAVIKTWPLSVVDPFFRAIDCLLSFALLGKHCMKIGTLEVNSAFIHYIKCHFPRVEWASAFPVDETGANEWLRLFLGSNVLPWSFSQFFNKLSSYYKVCWPWKGFGIFQFFARVLRPSDLTIHACESYWQQIS